MTRSSRRSAPFALVALVALAGCQDYNFSPVNQCLIQPGTERVTLSDTSTADILFVVDDSGSMGGKQMSLADSFQSFIDDLRGTNLTRVQNLLEPIDFHIAITTTSVFLNQAVPNGATCQATCGGKTGPFCCGTTSREPLTAARRCATAGAPCTATGGPWTCKDNNLGLAGELTCGDSAGNPLLDPVACTNLGADCGMLQSRYQYTHGPRSCGSTRDCRNGDTCRTNCTSPPTGGSYCCNAAGAIDPLQCNPGVSTGEYTLYPRGDFVKASTSASGPPPRVIHFTKDLFCTRNTADTGCLDQIPNLAEIARRSDWFKANVLVGTCGSGQEMGLEAGRRALRKALRLDGLSQPADVLPADWPHPKSKLVAVWVGDEDDCSTPEDASTGVVMSPTAYPDACVAEASLPIEQQRRYKLDVFSSFFTGLGRPLATGFIVSATGTPPPPDTNPNDCVDASCVTTGGDCTDPTCTSGPGLCGGQAPGVRFVELATDFRTMGSDVVVGSVCHANATPGLPPDFSSILDRVAEVVKQPSGLHLPTQPAAAALTILRIVGADGKTRKTCSAAAPFGTTDVPNPTTGAVLNDFDWWFTDGNDLNSQVPTGASRFIHINRAVHRCEANPGETYSADYLGLLPSGGCTTADDCVAAIGVPPSWTTPWECVVETGAPPGAKGTCVCGR